MTSQKQSTELEKNVVSRMRVFITEKSLARISPFLEIILVVIERILAARGFDGA
jgi:hypothetical protein